jgi:hypothetical protein
MLKLVAPALGLALFAGIVFAGPAGFVVRLQTSEVTASACRLAPGFQSAHLWRQALSGDTQDDDVYVRDVLSDARSVRSAVARFKAELQDRALDEIIAREIFVPGRLTLSGCANYAAYDGADSDDVLFPAFRVQ